MMTETNPKLDNMALALRQEFDRSFAQAPHTKAEAVDNLLAVRIGGDAYAIRVAEIGALHVDCRIMPLPTPVPELLGVATFRGQIAPVYDLAALLGYARGAQQRWLILMRQGETVALAFDTFEAHFTVLPDRIVSPSGAGEARPHLYEAVQTDGTVRPIIRLQSLFEEIQRRADLPVRQRSDQP